MNQVLSLVRAVQTNFEPGATLYSDRMLYELMVLHEEMMAQLRVEQLGGLSAEAFIVGMIAQHEKAALFLRAQLAHREARRSSSL